jgi:ABC-type proline/glycine betaine transport system substrate-binding protein
MEKYMHIHDQNSVTDADAAKRAAKRIKDRMGDLGYDAPLSHAYQILASNYGHPNWATMKALLERPPSGKPNPSDETGKVVWNDALETAYTDLCEWVVNFQFTTEVLSKMLETADAPEEIKAFSELLLTASGRLTETEQALTILHEIAVVQK